MSVGKLYPIGVFFFVKSNIIMDSYNILLQTDDYIPKKKLGRKIMNKYATLYWLIAVLLHLGYSYHLANRGDLIWHYRKDHQSVP